MCCLTKRLCPYFSHVILIIINFMSEISLIISTYYQLTYGLNLINFFHHNFFHKITKQGMQCSNCNYLSNDKDIFNRNRSVLHKAFKKWILHLKKDILLLDFFRNMHNYWNRIGDFPSWYYLLHILCLILLVSLVSVVLTRHWALSCQFCFWGSRRSIASEYSA